MRAAVTGMPQRLEGHDRRMSKRVAASMRAPKSKIVSGRQLRAARVLAGLTQAQLAQQAGFHERACRYWEAQGDNPPTSTPSSLAKIEAALGRNGVAVFRDPTPGTRLSPRR